jgi:hypothetical protein
MPTDLLKGVVLGVVLAGVPGVIWSWTLQVTGTAPLIMGEQAEQWTAQELRRHRRDGWRVVNHFRRESDDVDHILIGPGGVYAVETKWSAEWDSDYGRRRVQSAVRQSAGRAKTMSLWGRKHGFAVQPVVVLWGGEARRGREPQEIRVLNGVPVLFGPAVEEWVRSLPAGVMDPASVENAWLAVEAQVRSRDDYASEPPVPLSMGELVMRAFVSLFLAALGFLGVAEVLRLSDSVWWTVSLGAAALAPAVVALGRHRMRLGAWAWIVGVSLPTAALAISEVLSMLF